MVTNENPPFNRVYYSDVIAEFNKDALPFFADDYYFDIPFRVSQTVTGIKSAGRYLYIFGDSEVMILTGNSDNDWDIEQLSDSVGSVRPTSIQALQNVIYYLSDTGIHAISGGQVSDIGKPVSDLAKSFNVNALSSTVDFERELYYLSDGRLTLCWNARENGWTTRRSDGTDQQLHYAGGLPLTTFQSNGQSNLYSLSSPELSAMKITLGPFGQPATRRTWRGVSFAVDSDGAALATISTLGVSIDMDENPIEVTGAPQTRQIRRSGLTPLTISLAADTASVLEVTCTIEPDQQTRRCILRPPLTVHGSGAKEPWA